MATSSCSPTRLPIKTSNQQDTQPLKAAGGQTALDGLKHSRIYFVRANELAHAYFKSDAHQDRSVLDGGGGLDN